MLLERLKCSKRSARNGVLTLIYFSKIAPGLPILITMIDWIKLKPYPHFGSKFKGTDIPYLLSYVRNSQNIVKHKFYPLIHYTIKTNHYRRIKEVGVPCKEQKRALKSKPREIFYANHLDSHVFAYYSHLLNKKLNEYYSKHDDLNESVLAYRRIPFDKNRNKCNVDFAYEIFENIKSSQKNEIDVVCLDVTSFFDSLNHRILKKAWYTLLNKDYKSLPKDHYSIFKAITKFTYVEIGDIIKEFPELKIKKFKYLRNRNIESFCKTPKIFRERVVAKGLINYNKINHKTKKPRTFGIPQGTPISATLSNVFMIAFDEHMVKLTKEKGGIYRRYSDDILIICDPNETKELKDTAMEYLSKTLDLEIKEEKTQIIKFKKAKTKWSCTEKLDDGTFIKSKLSYLGFDFDGNQIQIRQKGISAYYRKAKRLIRRKARFAYYAKRHNQKEHVKKKEAWIYRKRIYKLKTHLGAKKKKIGNRVFWGNYISYAKSSARIMNEPAIEHQLRNHWRIIEHLIKESERKYGLEKTPKRRGKASI